MPRMPFFVAALLSFAISAATPALAQGMMKDGATKDQMSKDPVPETGCTDINGRDGMTKETMAKDGCDNAMSRDGMSRDAATKNNMMAPPK